MPRSRTEQTGVIMAVLIEMRQQGFDVGDEMMNMKLFPSVMVMCNLKVSVVLVLAMNTSLVFVELQDLFLALVFKHSFLTGIKSQQRLV